MHWTVKAHIAVILAVGALAFFVIFHQQTTMADTSLKEVLGRPGTGASGRSAPTDRPTGLLETTIVPE